MVNLNNATLHRKIFMVNINSLSWKPDTVKFENEFNFVNSVKHKKHPYNQYLTSLSDLSPIFLLFGEGLLDTVKAMVNGSERDKEQRRERYTL